MSSQPISARGGLGVDAVWCTRANDKGTNELLDDALTALRELPEAMFVGGAAALDSAAFERAQARASSAVPRRLLPDQVSRLFPIHQSAEVVIFGDKIVPAVLGEFGAMPLSSFPKNTPAPLSQGDAGN